MGLARARRRRRGASTAYVLVGDAVALEPVPRRGSPRRMDQPHLVVGIDEVLRRLGWDTEAVAGRSDGDGHRAGHRQAPASFAPVAQALRRRGRSVPAAARRTAKAWSRRTSTSSPNGGGAPPASARSAEAQASARPLLRTQSPMPRRRGEGDRRCARRCANRCSRYPSTPYPADVSRSTRVVAANALVSVVGQPLLGPARTGRHRRASSAGGSAPTRSSIVSAARQRRRDPSARAARVGPHAHGCPSTRPRWRTSCSARSTPTGHAAGR